MSSVYCISFWLAISALSCVESLCLIYSKWRPGLRIHTSFFLNHDCATKRTYMEIKTRILLLGILSILYGLFVTDIKYPRIDELRCYIISLNVPMLWWQKLVCTIFTPERRLAVSDIIFLSLVIQSCKWHVNCSLLIQIETYGYINQPRRLYDNIST